MVNTAIRGAALRPADDGSVLQHGRASGDACRGGVARPSDQARSGTIFDAASPVTIAGSRRAQAASATLPVLRVELLGPPRGIGQRDDLVAAELLRRGVVGRFGALAIGP